MQKQNSAVIVIFCIFFIAMLVLYAGIVQANGLCDTQTLELTSDDFTSLNYGSYGDSITINEMLEEQRRIDEVKRCPFSPGDKFKTKADLIFTLSSRFAVYAEDDHCLWMQRQGYAVHCEPVPIGYKWKVVFDLNGVEVEGQIDEEELFNLEIAE